MTVKCESAEAWTESADKQFSGRTKKGTKCLRRCCAQAAWAASHCKDGCLRAFFHRVNTRHGWGKAVFAVVHKILVIAYNLLKTGTPCQERGGDYFDRTARRLINRLEQLGMAVTVSPA